MLDPNKTQLGAPPSSDPNKTIMGSGPSLNTTITIKPVQCPVCKSFNPPGVMVCHDCGLIFEFALDGDAFGAPTVILPVLINSDGRQFQLRPGANIVGRTGSIEIIDPRVSRQHCQVEQVQGFWTVKDLGSTNGTMVDGEAVPHGESKNLQHNSTLSCGGYELKMSFPGEQNKTHQVLSGKTVAISATPSVSETKATLELPDRSIPLTIGSHTFGRKDTNEIIISDPYISGSHGRFDVEENSVYLTDIGSTNGTLLNEAKLAPNMKTLLQKGDKIRLGSLEISIKFEE